MPITREEIFSHHDAHPLVLDLLLTKDNGIEWWEWEPETVRQVIAQEYRSGISELVWHKIMAVKSVHASPGLVFDEWECFLPVITAFNNVAPDWDVLQKPSLPRLYAGVRMLRMLDPEEEFSREVKRFIACAVLDEGVYYAPGELSFVQELLRRPYYVCKDCGNEEEVLEDHDGICDECGKEYYSRLTGKPIKGPTTEVRYRFDEKPIAARFKEVAYNWERFDPDDDDEIDVQIVKIAAAIDYSLLRERQFMEQKEALGL